MQAILIWLLHFVLKIINTNGSVLCIFSVDFITTKFSMYNTQNYFKQTDQIPSVRNKYKQKYCINTFVCRWKTRGKNRNAQLQTTDFPQCACKIFEKKKMYSFSLGVVMPKEKINYDVALLVVTKSVHSVVVFCVERWEFIAKSQRKPSPRKSNVSHNLFFFLSLS